MKFEKLNNGAKVLEQKGNVVLADWNGQYVTWCVTADGDAYWGHYYNKSLLEATEDFKSRVEGK